MCLLKYREGLFCCTWRAIHVRFIFYICVLLCCRKIGLVVLGCSVNYLCCVPVTNWKWPVSVLLEITHRNKTPNCVSVIDVSQYQNGALWYTVIFVGSLRSLSSSLCNFLHSSFNSSLLGPNIILSTLHSNILSPRSSINVSDEVSHPYKTTCKFIVLYILIFIVLDSKLEDERFCTEC